MAYLIANIPPIEVFVRKEFLYDFLTNQNGKLLGDGEYESAHWLTVKSIPNQALYFESLIHDYGAVYDKLPLHAFVWRKDIIPSKLYPLDWLQLWDCMSYNISVIRKERLRNAKCEVVMKDKSRASGYYLFTVDTCASDPNEVDVGWSETPNEHKSFNIIKLDNGQFAAQPKNHMEASVTDSIIESQDSILQVLDKEMVLRESGSVECIGRNKIQLRCKY